MCIELADKPPRRTMFIPRLPSELRRAPKDSYQQGRCKAHRTLQDFRACTFLIFQGVCIHSANQAKSPGMGFSRTEFGPATSTAGKMEAYICAI